jgi:hypothetical protein
LIRNPDDAVLSLLAREPAWSGEQALKDYSLLRPGEMRELFPEAEIKFERFVGLPKSILAVKR